MLYSPQKLTQLTKRWLSPAGKTLLKLVKESRLYLGPQLFHQKAKNFPFIKEIPNAVDLRGAPLSGFDFRISVEADDEGFLEEMAILTNIRFEGATLRHCNFTEGKIHNCHFEQANLSHCDLKNSTLNNCSFEDADCTGLNLHSAKLINCNLTNANIRDVILNSTLVDEKTTFGKILKSDCKDNYHFASIEYKQIKETYKNSSLHSIADKYHYREMVAKRKTAPRSNPKRWLNYIFGDLLCKYGTSFGRVFLWSIFVIVICAILLKTNDSLLYNNAKVQATFLDSLYFSLVSFTTLGYGDFHAIGFMRFIAGLESFIGVTLMSLFTVIVGRQIIRD